MSEQETTTLLEEIATIRSYLSATEGVLDSGYMPDITALEERVAQVCARVQKTEQDSHEIILPQLAALVDHLNLCEKKMREFHGSRLEGAVP